MREEYTRHSGDMIDARVPPTPTHKSANDRQEGGQHYSSKYQHWDWVADMGLGYLAGNATKYVARARKKHGEEDLRKAVHYLEKLIEPDAPPEPTALDGFTRIDRTLEFGVANQLTAEEASILCMIAAGNFSFAREVIENMLERDYAPKKAMAS